MKIHAKTVLSKKVHLIHCSSVVALANKALDFFFNFLPFKDSGGREGEGETKSAGSSLPGNAPTKAAHFSHLSSPAPLPTWPSGTSRRAAAHLHQKAGAGQWARSPAPAGRAALAVL